MIERAEIQKEYFALIVKLNRGNKLKNEKTSLTFQVLIQGNKLELYANLDHASSPSRLILATNRKGQFWQVPESTGYEMLSGYLVNSLNSEDYNLDKERIILKVQLAIRKLFSTGT